MARVVVMATVVAVSRTGVGAIAVRRVIMAASTTAFRSVAMPALLRPERHVAIVAPVHRTFAQVPTATYPKRRDQLAGVFRLAFRALACLRVRARSDLLKLAVAGFAIVLVERHPLYCTTLCTGCCKSA